MKRKNIILAAFLLVLSIGQLRAQRETLPYKAASMFEGDTAMYLEYNYTIRSAQYKGKTFGEIIGELEYPVLYMAEITMISNFSSPSRVSILNMCIHQVGEKFHLFKDYTLSVWFENPPDSEDFKKITGNYRDNPFPELTPQLYEFLKDLKIKGTASNRYNLRDPELRRIQQERYKRIEEEGKRSLEILKQQREKDNE